MAELVDALVSNTNEVTLVPVRLRLWVQRSSQKCGLFLFRCFLGIDMFSGIQFKPAILFWVENESLFILQCRYHY